MKRWILPLTAVLLAACGQGGPAAPGGSKTYSKLGFATYFSFTSASNSKTQSGIAAAFGSNLSGTAPSTFDPALLDTCQLGIADTFYSIQADGPGDLNVGQSLSVRQNGMLVASISPQTNDNGVSYSAELNLTGLSGITLSAPGGTFPAFSNVPLPVPSAPLAFTSPANPKVVTASSTFSWTGASNAPGAVMFLLVGVSGEGGGTQGFTCTAKDDGSLSLPADFQSLLAKQSFTSGRLIAFQYVPGASTEVGGALLKTQAITSLGF